MSLSLEPYERHHLKTFQPGLHDRLATNQLYCETGWEGKAVSARVGERTVGILGIAVRRGTAHVWLVLSDEIREQPAMMSRWAKRSLVHILALPGVERIEAETDSPEATKWAEWLGFTLIEGKRYEYGGSSHHDHG